MTAPRFQFRPGVTIAAALALGVLVALGTWQLKRLEWKQDLIARVETRISSPPIPFEEAVRKAEAGENMEYAPVTLTGRFHHNKPADVFGSYEGVPGVYVFTPVRAEFGEFVYVNRGFASQEMRKKGWPETRPSETPIAEISGLLRYPEEPSPPASWFQTRGKSVDGLWFIRDPRAFAAEAGIDASPYYVDRFAVEGRDWPKGGTTRLEFSNRHLEYALTWYGLAAALVGVWIAFSLKRSD